jgi:CBS domain-containing protein
MRRDKLGCLPVVEGTRLVGMLTEIDVLRSIVGAEVPGSPELDIVISYP